MGVGPSEESRCVRGRRCMHGQVCVLARQCVGGKTGLNGDPSGVRKGTGGGSLPSCLLRVPWACSCRAHGKHALSGCGSSCGLRRAVRRGMCVCDGRSHSSQLYELCPCSRLLAVSTRAALSTATTLTWTFQPTCLLLDLKHSMGAHGSATRLRGASALVPLEHSRAAHTWAAQKCSP